MIELAIFYFIMGMVLAFTFAKTEHGFMAWVILWPVLITFVIALWVCMLVVTLISFGRCWK